MGSNSLISLRDCGWAETIEDENTKERTRSEAIKQNFPFISSIFELVPSIIIYLYIFLLVVCPKVSCIFVFISIKHAAAYNEGSKSPQEICLSKTLTSFERKEQGSFKLSTHVVFPKSFTHDINVVDSQNRNYSFSNVKLDWNFDTIWEQYLYLIILTIFSIQIFIKV